MDVHFFLEEKEKKKEKNNHRQQSTHHPPSLSTLRGKGRNDTFKDKVEDQV
jgi:hypothetical protein